MSDTIDLTLGEPDADESPAARRRRERKSERSDGSTKSSSASEDKSLVGRLDATLVKIADQMMARDDAELATAIREERKAMSQGIVSLTASVPPIRAVVLLVLALVEPLLAFWRVGRILFVRFLVWRERRIGEQEQAAEQWRREQEAGGVAVG